MERLTHRHENGQVELVSCLLAESSLDGCPDGSGCNCIGANKAYDRLAAYEDTGLTPEEVAELARAKSEGRIVRRGADTDIIDLLISLLDYIRAYRKYNTLQGIKYHNAGITWDMEDARQLLVRLLGREIRDEIVKAVEG